MPNYTNTPWLESAQAHRFSKLDGDFVADVAIVGAGITGMTAAVLLKRAGLRVAVLESRRVGKGETGRTTAHLTLALDSRYQTLISRFGREAARAAADGQRGAIDRIAAFVNELRIACDFAWVPGYLYSESEEDGGQIEEEAHAVASLGLDAAMADSVPLPFPIARALRFERQAQFHPRRYLLALAETVPGDGSAIFEEAHVVDIDDAEPCRVITERGVVHARSVIVAAHVPISNRYFLHTKLVPYRTYAVGCRTDLPSQMGLFWDTADPYHYIRTQPIDGKTYVIVGGEDHKVGESDDTADPFRRLEAYFEQRFGVSVQPTDYRWSGQIIEPVDGLPYIGLNSASEHVYVASGFAGNGMTSGTLAGMMLADQVRGLDHPLAELLSATRIKPLASARAFVSYNKDFPVHLVADRVGNPGPDAIAALPAGEGCVVAIEGERYAVYRDGAGHLSALSPICTHLRCQVSWNTTEKSWDCPCHGSRFDPTGRVLNGPAVEALEAKQLPVLAEPQRETTQESEEEMAEGVPFLGPGVPA